MLLPCAALRQPSKSAALAASDSLLPRTGCSLRSGCAMDESHGVGTQSSTLRGRGRAGKLTQVSFAVAQHGAAAPAFVRARSSPPSACSATLLQPRRRTTPLLRERLGRSTSGLKPYSERIALAVWFHAASRDTERRRSERGRKTDLTRSCESVRSDPPTFGPYHRRRVHRIRSFNKINTPHHKSHLDRLDTYRNLHNYTPSQQPSAWTKAQSSGKRHERTKSASGSPTLALVARAGFRCEFVGARKLAIAIAASGRVPRSQSASKTRSTLAQSAAIAAVGA